MRTGRIDSIVPDRELLLSRLAAAEDLDSVKDVLADFIETVGTYVFGYNERTGERLLGQFALAGGGTVFFTNTDERGAALRRDPIHHVLPQPDRIGETVKRRGETARAQRVKVGKQE